MAKLIIERHAHGMKHYHRVDDFPVTVGRALDNDVILSDLSVSPYHLEIEKREDGGHQIQNLSTENGTKVNKEKLHEGQGLQVSLPVSLWLGNSKIRLLSPDMKVEPTRVRRCDGFFCLYVSPWWAGILLLMALGIFLFDHFMSTSTDKPLGYFINASFTSVLYLVGFFLVIAGISRLATHRWDIVPAISVASLLFVVPELVDFIGGFANYYFTSDAFRSVALNLVNFLLLPILLVVFMMRIAHTPLISSLGVSLLVSSPFMAYQASDFISQLTSPDFSSLPSYNETLSSFDIRQQKTISIDEFIDSTDEEISKVVLKELDQIHKEME